MIERSPRARTVIFTLNDIPVDAQTFEAAVAAGYLPMGYFLNRVVINKLIDDTAWLFNSATRPWMLEAFDHAGKHEIPLNPTTLAQFFDVSAANIAAALQLVDAIEEGRQRELAATS